MFELWAECPILGYTTLPYTIISDIGVLLFNSDYQVKEIDNIFTDLFQLGNRSISESLVNKF